jgi:hypothetical protein
MDGGKKRSRWMKHVQDTMKANKGKNLMQILKMAKKTYKRSMSGGGMMMSPASATGGRRTRRRKTRGRK